MTTTSSSTPSEHSGLGPIVIIGILFFIFGFVTWLNGPLITFVKVAFNLNDINAFLVPMAFYLSYFFLALPASGILKWTGMKRGMALGLFVMAIGAVLFGQFATMRIFYGALVGLFVIGAGLALLQTAANPYISILGPIETGARRMSIMGICNKFAGVLAPLVFGVLVMDGIGELGNKLAAASPVARNALLNDFAAKVYIPYLAMAAVLVVLAIWVMRSSLPEVEASKANSEAGGGQGHRSIFAFPHLWLGVLCLFVYVGMEVMAGDAIGTYGAGFGLPKSETRFFTSFTMVGMLLGYLVGLALIPRFVSQQRYLAYSAVLAVVLAIAGYFSHGYLAVAFVAALGFANAMMWPAFFPLAIKGLGRYTEFGSALLIMGIAGGAIIPQIFVHLKAHIDFQLAFLVVALPCYLYILYYGLAGHKVGQEPGP